MINVTFQKVHDSLGGQNEGLESGCCMSSEHTVVAAFHEGIGSGKTAIYLSPNDGLTWAKSAEITGNVEQGSHRITNLKGNILILAVHEVNDDVVYVHRSTNAGVTWSTVASYPGPNQVGVAPLAASGGCGFHTSKAVLVGRFQTAAQGGEVEFLQSLDQGETWDMGPAIYPNDVHPKPRVIANGGAGNFCIGMAELEVWVSNDYCEEFQAAQILPKPAGFFSGEVTAFAWMDENVVLCAGGGNSSGQKDWPYLYRSTDRGDHWTHIDAADIASWPPHENTRVIWEVHRITKDMAIFFCDVGSQGDASGLAQSRVSIDGGLTWPIVPTGLNFPAPSGARSFGGCVTSVRGNLLVTAFTVDVFGAHNQIWRGTVTRTI